MNILVAVTLYLSATAFGISVAAMIGKAFGLMHVEWSTLIIWALATALITILTAFIAFLTTVSSGISRMIASRR